jgi:hypothetical protein
MSFLVPKGVSRCVHPCLFRSSRLLIIVGLLQVGFRRRGIRRRRCSFISGFMEITLGVGVLSGRHGRGLFLDCFERKVTSQSSEEGNRSTGA